MAVAARDVLAARQRPSLARAERRLIVGKPASAAGTVFGIPDDFFLVVNYT